MIYFPTSPCSPPPSPSPLAISINENPPSTRIRAPIFFSNSTQFASSGSSCTNNGSFSPLFKYYLWIEDFETVCKMISGVSDVFERAAGIRELLKADRDLRQFFISRFQHVPSTENLIFRAEQFYQQQHRIREVQIH